MPIRHSMPRRLGHLAPGARATGTLNSPRDRDLHIPAQYPGPPALVPRVRDSVPGQYWGPPAPPRDRDLHIPVQYPGPPALVPRVRDSIPGQFWGPPALSPEVRPGLQALAPRVSPSVQPQRHLAFYVIWRGRRHSAPRPARGTTRPARSSRAGPGHKFLGRVHACYNCCFIIRMIQHNNCTRAGRVHKIFGIPCRLRHSMPRRQGRLAPGARATGTLNTPRWPGLHARARTLAHRYLYRGTGARPQSAIVPPALPR